MIEMLRVFMIIGVLNPDGDLQEVRYLDMPSAEACSMALPKTRITIEGKNHLDWRCVEIDLAPAMKNSGKWF